MFFWKKPVETVDEDELDAAIYIQTIFRGYLGRRRAYEVYRSKHRKFYDTAAKRLVYQNKESLDMYIRAPKFLTFSKDLPEARVFEAPPDFDSGNENTTLGFGLLITNTQFPLGKWPAVSSSELEADHESLLNVFQHDFFCKLRPENIMSLQNPTTTEVQDAFKQLRRIVRADGFLVVYIATQVLTIRATTKELPEEHAYFAFRNSIWAQRKSIETIDTCIPSSRLAQWVRDIGCSEKTIFVNYAHCEPPRASLFSAPKAAYPPSDFALRLSRASQCPVVASCATGMLQREYVRQHPHCVYSKDFTHRRLYRHSLSPFREPAQAPASSISESPGAVAKVESSWRSVFNARTPDTQTAQADVGTGERTKSSATEPGLFDSPLWLQLNETWRAQMPRVWEQSAPPVAPQPHWETQGLGAEASLLVTIPAADDLARHRRRMRLHRIWGLGLRPVQSLQRRWRSHKEAQRRAPRETSLIHDGHTLFGRALLTVAQQGLAVLSSEEAVRLDTLFHHLQAELRKLLQIVRDERLQALQPTRMNDDDLNSPLEDANAEDGKDKAGAQPSKEADKDKKRKQAEDKKDQAKKDKKNKKNKKSKKKKKAAQSQAKEEADALTQTPILALPLVSEEMHPLKDGDALRGGLRHRVFFRAAPPPAPERPFVTVCARHSVTLTWYNAPFAGLAPLYYRLQMQNVSRNFSSWNDVRLPGGPESVSSGGVSDGSSSGAKNKHSALLRHFDEDEEDRRARINKGYAYYAVRQTTYTVRDLPQGVACRFRVQSCNAAGWSHWSPPTDFVTPGEDDVPPPRELQWRRLGRAGVLGLLDRMHSADFMSRADEVGGVMSRLAAWEAAQRGFKQLVVAQEVAAGCLQVLLLYGLRDAQVVVAALHALCWTLQSVHGRKVRHHLLQWRPQTVAGADTRQDGLFGCMHPQTQIALGEDTTSSSRLAEIVTALSEAWRHDSRVVNALQALRGANDGAVAKQLGDRGLVSAHAVFTPATLFPPLPSSLEELESQGDVEETEEERSALEALFAQFREEQRRLQQEDHQNKLKRQASHSKDIQSSRAR